MVEVIVDPNLCIGCGKCVDVCPADVFEIRESDKKVAFPKNASACMECHACEAQCPVGAIKVK